MNSIEYNFIEEPCPRWYNYPRKGEICMVVPKDVLENNLKRSRKQPREEISMPKKLSIEEIEKELGFDKESNI